jgi:hypothetical protein
MSEVVDKFNLLTEGLIAKGKAAELVELLKRLDTLPDLSVVADHAR